jgi:hypothetical protein
LLCADSKKVIVSRDVTFDESAFSSLGDASSSGSSSTPTPETTVEDLEVDLPVNVDPAITSSTNSIDSVASTTQSDSAFAPPVIHNHSIAQDRARRNIVLPPRYRDMAHYAFIAAQDIIDAAEPSSYSEAISCDNSSKWLIAMNDEFESLQRNSTWDLVELPAGKRPLKCKWIYKKKDGISGVEPTRWKARLVVKGFEQREGIDFNEVFSPVVRHSSIRVMLAIVALFDLELEQLDVKTAFLHGDLDEEIYMTQPDGFSAPGQEHLVCHLKKSLYGLKQAPRQWYKRFDSFMLAQNYSRSNYDHCIYFKQFSNGSFVYLLLYVDDMLIASHEKSLIDELKAQLNHEFDMKDLGPAKKILGMEIQRDRHAGTLFLSQKSYIEKVLERYNLNNCKPVATPFASHFKLSWRQCPANEEDKEYMSRVPYSSAVGNLMYAMICTRPDLAHAVSVVSRFMHNPGKEHWNAVKWILRYLKGTTDFGLLFDKNSVKTNDVIGFVDSDYAGDLDKRRSISGYIFSLCGSAVSWKASLQSVVALSTTEAEYVASTEGVKEAIWMRGLVSKLGVPQDVIKVYCDSHNAICLTKNDMFQFKTKHIDIKYHFIRDVVAEGKIIVEKVHTDENPADMLTKPLSNIKFKHCLNLVGIRGA